MIRLVRESDAKSIVEIYNYYIEHTIITFEEDTIDEAEMLKRIQKIMPTDRWIVYEDQGQVLGYAYASNWRTRVAYKNTLETTVYLNPESVGYGIGTKLYKALLNILQRQGVHVAIGVITIPNEYSVKLHEKLGFHEVGIFHEVGYKFGQWIDVGFYEMSLSFESNYRLEPLGNMDVEFLQAMLYEAIYTPEGAPRPSKDIIHQPLLRKYFEAWGQDDMGYKVIDRKTHKPVGAGWLKLFEPGVKGYGYIAEEIPELSMALLPAYRGKGIGAKLLTALLEMSKERYDKISLSVDSTNYASRLYERFGFELYQEDKGTQIRLYTRK